ncbi:hypothetical protein CRYUN_Cryun09bG0197200 [Craigia yunnanensis]
MDPELYEAAASGDLNFLKRIDLNLDVFQVTKHQQNSVLHIAVNFKQLGFCREILTSSSSSVLLIKSNSKGESALHVAAKIGCLEIAKLLVDCTKELREDVESWGVNSVRELLRMVNLEKDTALNVAVRNGHFAVAKYLIEADQGLLDLVNDANASPLCLAIEGGFSTIASFILEMFPKSLDGEINIKTALHSAVIHSQHGKEEETDIPTATHEASDEAEKSSRLEIHLLIAMLIATVTFQAAFTVPGGYKQDGPAEGTAQFVQKAAFRAFVIFNTIAFIFSIATVYIQFATSKFSYCLRSRYASLAEVMIFIAVLGMLLAFASGMYVELANSIGIYVGEDRVIHFIPTEINGFSKPEQKQPCENCKYQHNVHRGVVKTCLNCFLSDSVFSSNSLCLYEYEESSFVKMLKISGTCSTSKCLRPPEEVVQVANNLYEKKDFDSYGLIGNNCEHFATYCKTGTRCSAQVDGFMSVPIIGSLVNKMKNKLSS